MTANCTVLCNIWALIRLHTRYISHLRSPSDYISSTSHPQTSPTINKLAITFHTHQTTPHPTSTSKIQHLTPKPHLDPPNPIMRSVDILMEVLYETHWRACPSHYVDERSMFTMSYDAYTTSPNYMDVVGQCRKTDVRPCSRKRKSSEKVRNPIFSKATFV